MLWGQLSGGHRSLTLKEFFYCYKPQEIPWSKGFYNFMCRQATLRLISDMSDSNRQWRLSSSSCERSTGYTAPTSIFLFVSTIWSPQAAIWFLWASSIPHSVGNFCNRWLCGRSPCIEHWSTDDGIVGQQTIYYNEGDIFGDWLRIGVDGDW